MNSPLYHLQIDILPENESFYKDLMSHLGWSIILEDRNMIGYKSSQNGDLWFVRSQKRRLSDHDNIGVNHIAIKVLQKAEVDRAQLFLEKRKVKLLFGTPKHRPELSKNPDETYFQILFESPDRITFEIVYIGKK